MADQLPRLGACCREAHSIDDVVQSPFEQARTSKHYLRAKLVDLPDWPAQVDPLAGHAVAFPDVDLESLPRGHSLFGLGADAPTDLVLDAHADIELLDKPSRYAGPDGVSRVAPVKLPLRYPKNSLSTR